MTGTVEAALAAVRDGEGPHSLYTTLAPVYARLLRGADDYYDDQAWLVEAELRGDERSVLEVGPGTGELLARLAEDHDRVVGVDRHHDLLSLGSPGAGAHLVVGAPATLPVSGGFDACACLGLRTARLEASPAAAFEAWFDALAPGGRLVLDAPTEPAPVLVDPWEETPGRFRLDRSVAAGEVDGDRARMAVEYEVTDAETGETAETTEHVAIRLYDRDRLASLLSTAGFVDVEVTRAPGRDGALLATATRPEQ